MKSNSFMESKPTATKICRHKSGKSGSSSSGDSNSLKSEEAEGEGKGVRAKMALVRLLEPTRLNGDPEILDKHKIQ